MIYRYSKSDLLDALKEHLKQDEIQKVENWIQMCHDNGLYAEDGEEMRPEVTGRNTITAEEFFDWVYCVCRVYKYSFSDIYWCLYGCSDPILLQKERKLGLDLPKEDFEFIVRRRFLLDSDITEILSSCKKVEEKSSCPAERLYGEFYTLLFTCCFHKDTFLANLSNRYQLEGYISEIRKKEERLLDYSLNQIHEMEDCIQHEITKRASKDNYHEEDVYDENESVFEPWPNKITDTLTHRDNNFARYLSFLVYDAFPDDNEPAWDKRLSEEISLLEDYRSLVHLGKHKNLIKVRFEFGIGNSVEKCLSMSNQSMMRHFATSLYRYFDTALNLEDSEDTQFEKQTKNVLLNKLFRRTAVLLCFFGLYDEGTEQIHHMWFLDHGERHYVKFGSTYGAIIFNLLKSIPKVQALMLGRKWYCFTNKEKWDIVKYSLKNCNWQDYDITVENIPHFYPYH